MEKLKPVISLIDQGAIKLCIRRGSFLAQMIQCGDEFVKTSDGRLSLRSKQGHCCPVPNIFGRNLPRDVCIIEVYTWDRHGRNCLIKKRSLELLNTPETPDNATVRTLLPEEGGDTLTMFIHKDGPMDRKLFPGDQFGKSNTGKLCHMSGSVHCPVPLMNDTKIPPDVCKIEVYLVNWDGDGTLIHRSQLRNVFVSQRVRTGPEDIPIQVPPPAKYKVGQKYRLDNEDGMAKVTVWDGTHFRQLPNYQRAMLNEESMPPLQDSKLREQNTALEGPVPEESACLQEQVPKLRIQVPPTIKYKVGQKYILDYKDGMTKVTVWDGTHFRQLPNNQPAMLNEESMPPLQDSKLQELKTALEGPVPEESACLQEQVPKLRIQVPPTIKYKVGQKYILDYKDGIAKVTVWDGTHYRQLPNYQPAMRIEESRPPLPDSKLQEPKTALDGPVPKKSACLQEQVPKLQIQVPPTAKYKVGQKYRLDYKDGMAKVTVWDGTHFSQLPNDQPAILKEKSIPPLPDSKLREQNTALEGPVPEESACLQEQVPKLRIQVPATAKYKVGQQYRINYADGRSKVAVWDGMHFEVRHTNYQSTKQNNESMPMPQHSQLSNPTVQNKTVYKAQQSSAGDRIVQRLYYNDGSYKVCIGKQFKVKEFGKEGEVYSKPPISQLDIKDTPSLKVEYGAVQESQETVSLLTQSFVDPVKPSVMVGSTRDARQGTNTNSALITMQNNENKAHSKAERPIVKPDDDKNLRELIHKRLKPKILQTQGHQAESPLQSQKPPEGKLVMKIVRRDGKWEKTAHSDRKNHVQKVWGMSPSTPKTVVQVTRAALNPATRNGELSERAPVTQASAVLQLKGTGHITLRNFSKVSSTSSDFVNPIVQLHHLDVPNEKPKQLEKCARSTRPVKSHGSNLDLARKVGCENPAVVRGRPKILRTSDDKLILETPQAEVHPIYVPNCEKVPQKDEVQNCDQISQTQDSSLTPKLVKDIQQILKRHHRLKKVMNETQNEDLDTPVSMAAAVNKVVERRKSVELLRKPEWVVAKQQRESRELLRQHAADTYRKHEEYIRSSSGSDKKRKVDMNRLPASSRNSRSPNLDSPLDSSQKNLDTPVSMAAAVNKVVERRKSVELLRKSVELLRKPEWVVAKQQRESRELMRQQAADSYHKHEEYIRSSSGSDKKLNIDLNRSPASSRNSRSPNLDSPLDSSQKRKQKLHQMSMSQFVSPSQSIKYQSKSRRVISPIQKVSPLPLPHKGTIGAAFAVARDRSKSSKRERDITANRQQSPSQSSSNKYRPQAPKSSCSCGRPHCKNNVKSRTVSPMKRSKSSAQQNGLAKSSRSPSPNKNRSQSAKYHLIKQNYPRSGLPLCSCGDPRCKNTMDDKSKSAAKRSKSHHQENAVAKRLKKVQKNAKSPSQTRPQPLKDNNRLNDAKTTDLPTDRNPTKFMSPVSVNDSAYDSSGTRRKLFSHSSLQAQIQRKQKNSRRGGDDSSEAESSDLISSGDDLDSTASYPEDLYGAVATQFDFDKLNVGPTNTTAAQSGPGGYELSKSELPVLPTGETGAPESDKLTSWQHEILRDRFANNPLPDKTEWQSLAEEMKAPVWRIKSYYGNRKKSMKSKMRVRGLDCTSELALRIYVSKEHHGKRSPFEDGTDWTQLLFGGFASIREEGLVAVGEEAEGGKYLNILSDIGLNALDEYKLDVVS